MYPSLRLKFQGRETDQHIINMRDLGHSLVGVDKLVNSALVIITEGRPPRRQERFNFHLAAKEPTAGSVEIVTVLQQVPGLLPLVHEVIVSGGTEVLFRFLSWTLCHLGGRKMDSERHLDALVDITKTMSASRDEADRQWRNTLLEIVHQLAPAAKSAVSPIGRSTDRMLISSSASELMTEIDEPMASVIRSSKDDEVGDLQEMILAVDGIIHHSKQLKVIHPDQEDKYLTAEVRDPIFDEKPNDYTLAASNLKRVKVLAKPIYRGGNLYRIFIQHLIEVI